MSRFTPKVGDVYLTRSFNENYGRLHWTMQVIAVLLHDGERYAVCHKVWEKDAAPSSKELYMFDEEGLEVDSWDMDFAWTGRSRKKRGLWELEL